MQCRQLIQRATTAVRTHRPSRRNLALTVAVELALAIAGLPLALHLALGAAVEIAARMARRAP